MLTLMMLVWSVGSLALSPAAPSAPAITKAPEQRPLSAFPPGLRPLVKYGVGGGILLWFVGSLVWIVRQRLKQAKTPEAQAQARRWLRRLLTSILLAVIVLGVGVGLSLMQRELIYIWISAPLAVLLPPLLLVWWGKRN